MVSYEIVLDFRSYYKKKFLSWEFYQITASCKASWTFPEDQMLDTTKEAKHEAK